jgi:hypothetical protein
MTTIVTAEFADDIADTAVPAAALHAARTLCKKMISLSIECDVCPIPAG